MQGNQLTKSIRMRIKVFSAIGLCLVVFCALPSVAQITFTNMNSLLQSTGGGSIRDCAVDMNGDHLDDVVRVTNGGIYVDYQQSDGTFNGIFYPMNIQNMPNWSICAADIDANGFTDLLFGNGTRVSFVMANDDGTGFVEDARPEYIFSQRSTFADIDNDGFIDAFVCHDVAQSHPYRNDGEGYLVLDQSLIVTLAEVGNYSAIWVDYDNDGHTDLYISKCSGGAPPGSPRRINLLYRNNGDGTYSEVGAEANLDDDDQSWTTVFEDFDNDGLFDAFIVNHSWSNRMMHNNGDGTFTDIISGTGLPANDLGAWNCDGHDFDNNGYIDILCQFSNELWLNNGDGTFTGYDLPFNTGGIGDFNDDGFLDVVRGNNLWINNGNDNNWVKFNLEGLVSNKDAIGARVEIHGDFGMQVREVRSGESFAPMSTLAVHFGIGQHESIDEVIIKWPSGIITTLEDPEINVTHDLIEAPCIAEPNTILVEGMTTICPGESVQLTAEAGDSYTWSNGATTQSISAENPGSYSVIIWNGDCASVSNTVVVNHLLEEDPTIQLNGSDVICEGEEVEIVAGPASGWSWSNGETTQNITVSTGGDYFVTIDGLCDNVELVSDVITITALEAAALPEVENVQIGEAGSAELTAVGENLLWYDDEFGTEPVESGETFTTPFTAGGIWWVEANKLHGGEQEDGGKADNSGGGGLPATGAHSFFDVWEPFTLETVRVYAPNGSGNGTRTVQLVDASGVVLQEADFELTEGEHVIELNFEVPEGEGMSLRCPQHTLFRNSSGVSYPYPIGTVGSIYDSFYGGSYYYYFYDWKIRKPEFYCPSPRVAVEVSVVNVEDVDGLTQLTVYPNPARDLCYVSIDLESASTVNFTLTDVAGRMVEAKQLNVPAGGFRHTLELGIAPGVYNLSFDFDGQRVTRKLIVD